MRRLLALVAVILLLSPPAHADILDSETWDNHVEQIQEMETSNQYRRTMNRWLDRMPGVSNGGSSSGPSAASETAAWRAALLVPATQSRHELDVLLAKSTSSTERRMLRTYMLQRLAAYPAEARRATPLAFDPRNIVHARLFALQGAYRIVRPDSPIDGAATLLLNVALSRQMTRAFSVNHYSIAQKQDARNYYIIMRALIAPAFQHIAAAGPIDANTHRKLAAFALAFLRKDTAVDPARTSWAELPCVGISAVDCQVQTAMARAALNGQR